MPGATAAAQARRWVPAGRDSPVALERNPLSEVERERVLEEVAAVNPDSDPYFWERWLAEPEA